MRCLLQRVREASVDIDGHCHARIGPGLLVLVGVEAADGDSDIDWLCRKLPALRIFPDIEGRMNRSLVDSGGELLAVSQFTLFASTRKGTRPGFSRAAPPDIAAPLFNRLCNALTEVLGQDVPRGVFGADMKISLINDGPVTIMLDSRDPE